MDFLEAFERVIDAVLEHVGHRGEIGKVVGFERLRGGAGAASAATDEADFDGLRALHGGEDGGGAEKEGSGLQEVAAGVLFHRYQDIPAIRPPVHWIFW